MFCYVGFLRGDLGYNLPTAYRLISVLPVISFHFIGDGGPRHSAMTTASFVVHRKLFCVAGVWR